MCLKEEKNKGGFPFFDKFVKWNKEGEEKKKQAFFTTLTFTIYTQIEIANFFIKHVLIGWVFSIQVSFLSADFFFFDTSVLLLSSSITFFFTVKISFFIIILRD